MTFVKSDPRPCARLKQVFSDCFELVVALMVLREFQNALRMGCFGTKNESKMGQKGILPNLILAHANCTLFCVPNAQKRTGSQ